MKCSLDYARAHRVEQAAQRYGIDLTVARERMFLRLVAAQGHVLARQPRGNVIYLVRHMRRWILLCISERQRRIRTFLPLGPEAWLRQQNGDRLLVGTVIDATLTAHRLGRLRGREVREGSVRGLRRERSATPRPAASPALRAGRTGPSSPGSRAPPSPGPGRGPRRCRAGPR